MPVKKKKKMKKSGFTLIEMVVVIFVVGIGLVGAVSFFNINLNNQFEAKNELIAAGLAEEENDIVRNIVDRNSLNGQAWYSGLSNSNGNGGNKCKSVDFNDLTTYQGHLCASWSNVCLDPISFRYSQCNSGSSNKTIFSRDVAIDIQPGGTNLDTGDCLSVITTVTWNGRTTQARDIICKPRS